MDELLARQAGVLSLAQARAAGLSEHSVRRRVATGAWVRVHPRVYRVATHRPSDEGRVRAAWLWAGSGAVVSGTAAAFVHGMADRAPALVGITVPVIARRRPPPGIALRRRDLSAADRTVHRGLEVTATALTALEAAIELGPVFLDRALQRHVSLDAVRAAYRRNLGAHGWARVRPMLVAAGDRAASAAERLLLAIVREAGLTGWVVGHPVGPWLVDLAFPRIRVAVEVDGWAWHVDAERFGSDRREQNALVTAGWTVLRFTWHDLTQRPGAVLAELRAGVERAA